MPLDRKEVHLLALIAKNRDSSDAQALVNELHSKLSPAARRLAKEILAISTPSRNRTAQESTAQTFARLADARNEARQNRFVSISTT